MKAHLKNFLVYIRRNLNICGVGVGMHAETYANPRAARRYEACAKRRMANDVALCLGAATRMDRVSS